MVSSLCRNTVFFGVLGHFFGAYQLWKQHVLVSEPYCLLVFKKKVSVTMEIFSQLALITICYVYRSIVLKVWS